jgi:hypothetical protein
MQSIETLKAQGQYREAGALAFTSGQARSYGCHYGMRSDRDAASLAFQAGYDAAAREAAKPR